MIASLIRASIANRFLVLVASLIASAWGIWAVSTTPLDAIPDLSDVQVIIRTTYPGQAPQIVEDQVTYPLTTTMLSVPGAKTVRGYSFFGDSFVYVLFERRHGPVLGTLARARIPEPGAVAPAREREGLARARRDRRRLDLRVRAGGSQRAARPGAAARVAGLVPQVRAEDRAPTWPKWRPSAAWCGSTRSCSIPTGCAPMGYRSVAWSRRSEAPTRRLAARCSSWARPSTWCALRAT